MSVVKIDSVGTVRVDANPGTPEFDKAIDEIKQTHGRSSSESIAGTSLGVARGLVQGIADMPIAAARIGLAQQRIPEMLIQQAVPGWHPAQSVGQYLDQIEHKVNEKIANFGPKGYSTNIGPVDISGEALGQLISGAAIPGAVFGGASKATSFAGRMWSAVKGGAAFGAATSVPNVVLSRDFQQANERLINAGVSIGIGGLLAGGLHGSAEAVGKLLSLRRMQKAVPPVEGGPGAPEAAPKGEPENRWNEIGEYIHDRMKGGSGKPRPPVEPHLDIKPGLEGAPQISAEEVARIKAERIQEPPELGVPKEQTPAEKVKAQRAEFEQKRTQQGEENQKFVEEALDYVKAKADSAKIDRETSVLRDVHRAFRKAKTAAEKLLARAGVEKTTKSVDETLAQRQGRPFNEEIGDIDSFEGIKELYETKEAALDEIRFHGSRRNVKLDEFGHLVSDNNLYGPGFYTTKSENVAKGYAGNEPGMVPEGTVYEIREKGEVQAYNLDQPIQADFFNALDRVVETGDPAAKMLRSFVETYPRDDMSLQLQKLQEHYVNSEAYTDFIVKIQRELKKEGYGAFDHEGGRVFGGEKHPVRIYWDPHQQLKITDKSSPHGYYDAMLTAAIKRGPEYGRLYDALAKSWEPPPWMPEAKNYPSIVHENVEQLLEQLVRSEKEMRAYAADRLKEKRAYDWKVAQLNAEMEATAEVIAARGFPVGEVWEPGRKLLEKKHPENSWADEAFRKEYIKEMQEEMTRRIKAKKEALEGSDPGRVNDAWEPMQLLDPLRELTENTTEAKKLRGGTDIARVAEVRDEVLADRAGFIQRVFKEAVDIGHKAVEWYQNQTNPMRKLSSAEQGAFKPQVVAEMMELRELPALDKALRQFKLEERQLPALFNDPRGRERLSGLKIGEDMSMILDSVRVFFDKYWDIGVRRGVISEVAFWKDFINRSYAPKDHKAVLEFMQKNGLIGGDNVHSMERWFQTLWEAKKAGFETKSLDIANLVPDYVRSLSRTILNNEIMGNLFTVAPEKFKWIPEKEHVPPGFKRAPEGLLAVGDLSVVEGKPAKLYIESDLNRVLTNLVSQGQKAGTISTWNAAYKMVTLAVDIYHLNQLLRGYWSMAAKWHESPFGKWKLGMEMLQPGHEKNPMVVKLMELGGLSPGRPELSRMDFDKAAADFEKASPSMAKAFRAVGLPFKAFADHLWGKQAPGLNILMGVKNLELLMKDPRTVNWTEEQMYKAAAEMANKVIGSQNWRTFGRSRGTETVAKLLLLAPRWLETRFQLVGGAVKAVAEAEASSMAGGKFRPSSPEGVLSQKYWTGYVLQGMATAAALNGIIQAAYPETKKYKETQGLFGNLTHVTFPVEDRHGRPLVMSPFPGLDYILEAAHDWRKFYKNRMSPAASLLLHLVTGTDYKGAKDSVSGWSLETWLGAVGDLIPLPMFYGGMERVALSETPGYEGEKLLFRSILLGLHNHPTYPTELLDEQAVLFNRAAELKKNTAKLTNPILKTIFSWQIDRHNRKVDGWIEAVKKTEGAEKIGATIEKNRNRLYVAPIRSGKAVPLGGPEDE